MVFEHQAEFLLVGNGGPLAQQTLAQARIVDLFYQIMNCSQTFPLDFMLADADVWRMRYSSARRPSYQPETMCGLLKHRKLNGDGAVSTP
jgi:hypothetical protein